MSIPEKAVAAQEFQSLEIKAGRTPEETEVHLNGKKVGNFESLSLTLWNDGIPPHISLNYTTREQASGPGQVVVTKSFHLVPPSPDQADASISVSSLVPENLQPRRDALRISEFAQIGVPRR
jgi:hypothetical protein